MIRQVNNRSFISYKLFIGFALIASLSSFSCKSENSEVKQMLEAYIKKLSPDVTDTKLDLFHTNPSFQNKAYASVTITHGFSSADGKPQREFLGFILVSQDNKWKVDEGNHTGYTIDPKKADTYLAGGK